MQSLQRQLTQAGAHPRHIRKLTTYVTDRAWLAPVDAVLHRHLNGLAPAPARVTLIVSGLATPEMLVALDIEAVIAP